MLSPSEPTTPDSRAAAGPPPPLKWSKTPRNTWWKLLELGYAELGVFGVYVIWHGGYPSRVVKVGYGDIAARLGADAHDATIMDHAMYGPLFVTWAAVDPSAVEGVARHLAEILRPQVASAASTVAPIAVNSPF